MRIVFVADYFMKDMPGGSERSLQAIIDSAPVPVWTVRSGEFRARDYGLDDFLIFGNFTNLPLAILPDLSQKLNYAVIESDHKYCIHRSPEQHKARESKECDCHKNDYGMRICRFYQGAKALFWKSTIHMERHLKAFPELKREDNTMLSATYSDAEIDYLLDLGAKKRLQWGWAVFKSTNWIKGYEDSVAYCKRHNLWRIDIKDNLWTDTMKTLSHRKGIVFLPRSMESCSRIAIEAHLLGIDIIVNNNVPVAQEEWFKLPKERIAEYLKGRTRVFWDKIMEYADIEAPVTAEMVT